MRTRFKLEFTPRFERRLKDLDREIQIRILQDVQILTENPFAGKLLKGQWQGTYSLRIGGHRIVYLVSGDKIILLTVGHRKKVYR